MPENLAKFEFRRVDEAADPQSFVDYLDNVSLAMEQYKQLGDQTLAIEEGDSLLDLGCGTGDDTRRLAALVGANGRVVGIDSSEVMITEARRRAEGSGLPVEFRVGDAHRLELAEAEFDGARAERVFQHLPEPARALAELARVTRPGGRVTIGPDPDWETLVIDCSHSDLLRRVKTVCGELASGGIAHKVPALMRALGLENVSTESGTILLQTLGAADAVLDLSRVAEQACDAGAISEAEHADWMDDLRTRDEAGDFFLALTGFLTSGRNPLN
jgi:ubiquinone/menaquinone biosynthesis C-methylase UbiE